MRVKISRRNLTSCFALSALLTLVVGVLPSTSDAAPAPMTAASVTKVVAGATPFIAWVTLTDLPGTSLSYVSFTIANKPSATGKAISATYKRTYLSHQGFFNTVNDLSATVPVYGLYQNYTNTITLKIVHGSLRATITTTFKTAQWTTTGEYGKFTKVTPRNPSISLGYSFMLLKDWNYSHSPVIMDTDGNVRWIGNCNTVPGSQASVLDGNNIFIGAPGTGTLFKESFDGKCTRVANYSSAPYNVNNIAHHNIDLTSKGLLLDVESPGNTESQILAVKTTGKVIKQFKMVTIFRQYLLAHGETPNGWIRPTTDWFHNNSATYWPANNELVVSSRENFVVGINWTTNKIDWILGTETKQWYVDFPALRSLAITLTPGSLYPIGQHGISINTQGDLMLFDDGYQSLLDSPVGPSRSYSTVSSYSLTLTSHTGTMVWNYTHTQNIFSPICSSIYEMKSTYLIDYAAVSWGANVTLIGLGAGTQVAFDYQLGGQWTKGWNAAPVNLSTMTYLS